MRSQDFGNKIGRNPESCYIKSRREGKEKEQHNRDKKDAEILGLASLPW
jgi:hypothetical protein